MREKIEGKVEGCHPRRYHIYIYSARHEADEVVREKPCDYYSRSIIEDAEADERIQPMETEAEVVVKNL